MFAPVILVSTFTAGITNTLTANRLWGQVQRPTDLQSVRVGAVSGPTSEDYLQGQRIQFVGYKDGTAGLEALKAGAIGAMAYDRPLLAYLVKEKFSASLEMLPVKFNVQTYGIA